MVSSSSTDSSVAPRNPDSSTSSRVVWAAVVGVTVLVASLVAAAFYVGYRRGERSMTGDLAPHEMLTLAGVTGRLPAAERAGLLAALGLGAGDEGALGGIAWVSPPMPAPFVGHVARPGRWANASINRYGFRDLREDYGPLAPGQQRVFITGGSSAWGSGLAAQEQTVAGVLEAELDAGRHAGDQVINAAYPAWATAQERLIITQRIVRLKPTAIVMFSGTNDVHWALLRRDTSWFWSYAEENWVHLLARAYERAGFGPLNPIALTRAEIMTCDEVAAVALENVELAAHAASRIGVGLVFALQPTIFSTAKPLSARELSISAKNPSGYWRDCYGTLRRELARVNAPGYRFLDLSTLFGDLPPSEELFIDPYHFGPHGHRSVAGALHKALSSG